MQFKWNLEEIFQPSQVVDANIYIKSVVLCRNAFRQSWNCRNFVSYDVCQALCDGIVVELSADVYASEVAFDIHEMVIGFFSGSKINGINAVYALSGAHHEVC